jgi:hypothetical protein
MTTRVCTSRTVCAAVLVWLTMALTTWADAPSGVTVFYLPFSVNTLVPVTPDSIEQYARCRVSLATDSARAKMLRTFVDAARPGHFDWRVVRVKIVGLLPEPIFVDRDGGLRIGRAVRRKFQAKDFERFKAFANDTVTAEGCDPMAFSGPSGKSTLAMGRE